MFEHDKMRRTIARTNSLTWWVCD